MKIAEINMVDYGSTGNIMLQIADCAIKNGYIVKTFSKKWKRQHKKREFHDYYGTTLENGIHVILTRTFGFQGGFSYFGTKQLVKELKKFNPDIIHLHNLHDYSTCLPVLFKYLSLSNVPVVWTLHDCWSMTGNCSHFMMAKCDRWKSGCFDCKQLTSKLKVDCSKYMWKKKKEWFTNVKNMTIVTPSLWLSDIVEQSYLNKFPIKVINNGIDLDTFKPTESDFRKKYNLNDKHVVLGVAFGWGRRKGLDVFIELSKRLSDRYRIVLVGIEENVEKLLDGKIISIHRTQNQIELAEIYTSADVFVNPTREDTFPTTNIEALACGIPVITFKTGGSPEILDNSCGLVIECDNVNGLEEGIIDICERQLFTSDNCTKRANTFNKHNKYQEYLELFESIACNKSNEKCRNCTFID